MRGRVKCVITLPLWKLIIFSKNVCYSRHHSNLPVISIHYLINGQPFTFIQFFTITSYNLHDTSVPFIIYILTAMNCSFSSCSFFNINKRKTQESRKKKQEKSLLYPEDFQDIYLKHFLTENVSLIRRISLLINTHTHIFNNQLIIKLKLHCPP